MSLPNHFNQQIYGSVIYRSDILLVVLFRLFTGQIYLYFLWLKKYYKESMIKIYNHKEVPTNQTGKFDR